MIRFQQLAHLVFAHTRWFTIGVALAFFGPPLAHASLPAAEPPSFQFQPEIDVYPQNFAIEIDRDERVFLGNADGVLIFDGEFWQHLTLPNADIVRSLAFDGNDRVYVGGYDAFGYIEKRPTGRFDYIDLTPLFNEALAGDLFADIWHIKVAADAVYFVALEHLFRFEVDSGAHSLTRHEGSFGPIAEFQGNVFLQFRGEGLKVYDQGQWQPLHITDDTQPDYARTFISNLAVLNDQTMIMVNPESTWHKFDGRRFEPLTQFDALPHKGGITNARVIDQSNIVLTTQIGKVVYLNVDTGSFDVIDVGNGFLPDVVLSKAGKTLVVDSLGFHAVNWPARWKSIGRATGLQGEVNAVVSHEAKTYILSSSGVFVSQSGTIAKVDWTDYEAWALLPVAADELLFADSYEISHRTASGTTIIDDSTTARELVASEYVQGRIYVGTELGLQILQRSDGTYRTVFRNDSMDNMRVTEIIELSATEILLGSERGGVRHLRINLSENGQDLTMTPIEVTGVRYGVNAERGYIYRIGEKIIASTDVGFFEWRDNVFVSDDLGNLESLRPNNEALMFGEASGNYWAFNHNTLIRKNGQWHIEDVSALKQGAISSVSEIDGQTIIGSLGKLLVFDSQPTHLKIQKSPVTISAVTLAGDDSGAITPLPLTDIQSSSDSGRLTVRYALADFDRPGSVRYRTRLTPTESQFTPWSRTNQQSLVALAPGLYTLQIEAMDSKKQISALDVEINIEPLWFESYWFQGLALLLLLLLFYMATLLFLQRRNRNLAAEKDRLESMVSERTRALQSANQQLDKMAHLDGLTQIPNRRRLDSYLDDVWRQCAERSRVLAIAIIDADHFKRYNDTHGHLAGDQLLIELARLLSRNLRRAEDLVARYGGEEFIVVLPGADGIAATQVVEDMRQAVEASELDITISAGLFCSTPSEDGDVAASIEKADAALYSAKATGRNKVIKSD